MQTRGRIKLGLLLMDGAEALPKVNFSYLPTPFERMNNLSQKLGVNLFIKREDQTGLAFGGNKARKLEYIMADAIKQGADSIITWAGIQSNWCRQLTAAARRLGIKPILVLYKRPAFSLDYDGNFLLDFLLGAEMKVIELGAGKSIMEYDLVKHDLEEIAEAERRKGGNPYIAPIGGSMTEGSMMEPWGAISYVEAMFELHEQALDMHTRIDYVIHATGSGSTQAGLVVGAKIVNPDLKVIGISVSEDGDAMSRCVEVIARQTAKYLGQSWDIDEGDVIVFDEYIHDGYGVLDQQTADAMQMIGQEEGVLIDPVYTGRAMVGLLDLIDKGYFEPGANVLFLHTGGTPAIFPYREGLLKYLQG